MRYFSMFSGIGGFELGIQRVFGRETHDWQPTTNTLAVWVCNKCKVKGFSPNELPKYGCRTNTSLGSEEAWNERMGNSVGPRVSSNTEVSGEQPQRGVCVGYSEVDKYAIKVYERNFNGHRNYGDATTIEPTELPVFDLLCGGFPCQSFSIAGKRRGFSDTRGTLFFDIARILKDKRPQHLLLENVKGLLSHDSGKTFQAILGVLSDLGYSVEWQVLNSKDFDVPQNRERIYIIGHLGDECARQVFPIGQRSKRASKTVPHQEPQAHVSQTVDSRTGAYPKFGQYIAPVLTPDRAEKRQNGRRFKENGEPSFTLTGQDLHGVYDGVRIRRLTPLECERLRGFPDDWTKYGGDSYRIDDYEISDTQRYKMCGNAVTVNVVEAVITEMCNKECLL